MTKAKKTGKKATPAKTAAKKPAAKQKTSGLLGKLKGALSRQPAAASKAKRPASKVSPAKKSVKSKAKPAPAVKAVKPVVARKATKTVSAKNKVVSAKKTAPSKAAEAPKKSVPAAAVSAAVVAKPAAKAVVAKPATKPARRFVPGQGRPSEDQIREMDEADYMSDVQLEFFRHRLLQMRQEVLQRELDVKERLHEREVFADPADRATAEEEHWLDLRLRERESLLLKKIDEALRRIENKDYGYCEKTGDAIGIPRLLARPTATVCVDVKGQDERVEAQFRDR
jgi:DnaK suppressor protein